MTTREIRNRAAEILEASEDAWCQGDYLQQRQNGRYAYCIMGACEVAAGYYDHDNDDRDATHDAYVAAIAATIVHPQSWNDRPGRTRAEVIAALRAC